MAKDKKKHAKKEAVSDNLLDMAALSIKKFRKVTKQISKLSTGQKIAGSLALAAVGLTYLVKQPDRPAAETKASGSATTSPSDEAVPELVRLRETARRRKKPSDD